MAEADLTKQDLTIMMQSYENMILMHKTVLDQQGHIINTLKDVIMKQDEISGKQMSSVTLLQGVTGKLDECSEKLSKSQEKLDRQSDNLIDKLNGHNIDSIKEHGKIKNRLYVAYGGSGVIIIALLGIIWKIWGGGS